MPGPSSQISMYAEVAIPLPLDKTFTYIIPDPIRTLVAPGMRVLVPFGRKKQTGFLLRITSSSNVDHPSPITDCLDLQPVFSESLLKLAEWIADYYMTPIGLVLQSLLPPGIHQESDIRITLKAGIGEFEINAIRRQKPIQARILNALYVDKTLSRKELQKKIKSVQLKKHLKELERMGIIEQCEMIGGQQVSERFQKFVELAPAYLDEPERLDTLIAELERRSPKQAAVMSFLGTWSIERIQNNEDLSIRQAELLAETGAPLSALKALAEKKYLFITEREVSRNPYMGIVSRPQRIQLNEDQTKAVNAIQDRIYAGEFHVLLLHGVTASGKTQVYIEALKTILAQNRSAIILVPEISLTSQAVERFRSYFPDQVTVWHSKMSLGERFDTWRHIHSGKYRIVIGARSAVFSPVQNLGLIVVDEEHESTYKQTDAAPRYHARDVAIMRAAFSKAVVVLGSATPSLESYYNAQTGKYTLLELPKRIRDAPLPEVEVIDMREEKEVHTEGWIPAFSRALRSRINDALRYHQQVILFLNRRGYASYVQCFDCGYVAECPNCSISLTYHAAAHRLRCHYCGHSIPEIEACPECGQNHILSHGIGTQRVEEQLKLIYPKTAILRMDLDTTSRKDSHHRILEQFKNKEASILLGTQMITKGLDFENVTVVGVISADTSLLLPDFRSSERTFQLLTQVAGRAGRKDKTGHVVIQTFNPDRTPIRYAQNHDFHGFYHEEIRHREELMYPPFGRLIVLVFKNEDEKKVIEHCQLFSDILRQEMIRHHWAEHHAIVLGPAAAPITKVRNQYRWQILIKINKTFDRTGKLFRELLRETEEMYREKLSGPSSPYAVEIDPNHLL